MSNYHILNGSKNGNQFTVVFHVSIPNVNNEVGVNYRAAIVQAGTVTSQVPFIDAGEQSQIDAGELVEESYRFTTHSGETLAQKRDRLDAIYPVAVTRVQDEWAKRFSYWGYGRDVP
jgi:hypothetical protein